MKHHKVFLLSAVILTSFAMFTSCSNHSTTDSSSAGSEVISAASEQSESSSAAEQPASESSVQNSIGESSYTEPSDESSTETSLKEQTSSPISTKETPKDQAVSESNNEETSEYPTSSQTDNTQVFYVEGDNEEMSANQTSQEPEILDDEAAIGLVLDKFAVDGNEFTASKSDEFIFDGRNFILVDLTGDDKFLGTYITDTKFKVADKYVLDTDEACNAVKEDQNLKDENGIKYDITCKSINITAEGGLAYLVEVKKYENNNTAEEADYLVSVNGTDIVRKSL